jgi:hypothetical protein
MLPRCVKAWAAVAATAAAAWEGKEIGGPKGAERIVPSPVNFLATQNPNFKSHQAPAQSLRSSIVKGQTLDNHAGWFSGGSVSPPTEAAGTAKLLHRAFSLQSSLLTAFMCHLDLQCFL